MKEVKVRSDSKFVTIITTINGEERKIIIPSEYWSDVLVAVRIMGFDTAAEMSARLVEHAWRVAGRRRPLKTILLEEVARIIAVHNANDCNDRACRRDLIQIYLDRGLRHQEISSLINAAAVTIGIVERQYLKLQSKQLEVPTEPDPEQDPEPVVPEPTTEQPTPPKVVNTTQDIEEVDEYLVILNHAKSMFAAINSVVEWKSLPMTSRVMWVDSAIAELSTTLITFADALSAVQKEPGTRISRKSWDERNKYVTLGGEDNGALRIFSPSGRSSVWFPSSEDLLANDWFVL